MNYDPKLPEKLKTIQTWFGSIIQQEMTENYEIHYLSPQGVPIGRDAKKYISGTKDFTAKERMQLYNQSYWLRLLTLLREEFPLLVRLFGEKEFNQILGIPYLHHFPPRHWNLHLLADRFTEWLEKYYTAKDRKLVLSCGAVDWACQELFIAKRLPSIQLAHYNGKNASKLLKASVRLQSTIRLFTFPFHLMLFREEMLKQSVEYWQTNNFPSLLKDKTYYFILFRSLNFVVKWEELSKDEYLFFDLVVKKGSFDQAIDALSENENIDLQNVESNMSAWAQKWLMNGWLSPS